MNQLKCVLGNAFVWCFVNSCWSANAKQSKFNFPLENPWLETKCFQKLIWCPIGKSLVVSKVLLQANSIPYMETLGWKESAYKSKFNVLWENPLLEAKCLQKQIQWPMGNSPVGLYSYRKSGWMLSMMCLREMH